MSITYYFSSNYAYSKRFKKINESFSELKSLIRWGGVSVLRLLWLTLRVLQRYSYLTSSLSSFSILSFIWSSKQVKVWLIDVKAFFCNFQHLVFTFFKTCVLMINFGFIGYLLHETQSNNNLIVTKSGLSCIATIW